MSVYVSSISGVTGKGCAFSQGTNYTFQMTFNGTRQPATVLIMNPDDPVQGVAVTRYVNLPSVQTDGNTWTGNYLTYFAPGGPVSQPEPFTGTLDVTTRLTAVGTMTFTAFQYGKNTGSCNVSWQYSSARTGPGAAGISFADPGLADPSSAGPSSLSLGRR